MKVEPGSHCVPLLNTELDELVTRGVIRSYSHFLVAREPLTFASYHLVTIVFNGGEQISFKSGITTEGIGIGSFIHFAQ